MQHRKTLKVAASISALGLVMALGACSGEQKPETPTVQPAPTGQGGGKAQPSDGEGTKETTSAPSEDTASSDKGGVNSGCSLPDGDQKIPNTAPPVDEWVSVNGIGVPTSKAYGPEKREGDLFGCYAHSPTGALFAMTYITGASGRTDGFFEEWLTPEDFANMPETNGTQDGTTLVLRGFRFSSATKDEVAADLAWDVTTPEGQSATMVMRFIVKWSDDHWVMEPKMFDTPASKAPANLEGFTPWSANNG
ncbi:hypothetical protein [Dermabacter sp.]|uniref:hypothetical protein n=1 Tax=Dermabacter sp. TaxID=37640 RepID=UPI002906E0EB|nr:hypothetical protein [Dermabacter sp.]MDU4924224.1 hypothetical protein [Dermabacter sp.]